jgi:hypothetical protein
MYRQASIVHNDLGRADETSQGHEAQRVAELGGGSMPCRRALLASAFREGRRLRSALLYLLCHFEETTRRRACVALTQES